ncbi:hypothetical protein BH11ARM2_BH11ARM2_35410 [soil metagenome]
MTSPPVAFLVGLFLSALNTYGTRIGLRMAANRFAEPGKLGWGTAFIVALGFVKLPLLMLAGLWYMRQPTPAPGWFLAGFGLVYFVLFGWALAGSKGPPEAPGWTRVAVRRI